MRVYWCGLLRFGILGFAVIGLCQMLVQTQIGHLLSEFNDVISTRSALLTLTGLSKLQCASACLKHLQCSSFFYLQATRKCRLLSAVLNIYTSGADFRSTPDRHPGNRYYQLSTGLCGGCPCWALPRNYVYNSSVNICYAVKQNQVTWDEAWQTCADDGGHLLFIADQTVQDWLIDVVKAGVPGGNAYVDGTDSENEGTFANYKGETMSSITWSTDEPNNADGNEHCIEVTGDSQNPANDVPCTHQLHFVCQIEI